MSTIAEFSQRVEEMEAGALVSGFENRLAAIDQIIDRICGQPWGDAEERSAAQILVYRLARLRRQGDGVGIPTEAPAPAPPRKRAKPARPGTAADRHTATASRSPGE